ncbi:transposase [Nostoc sp.]|uniref:transposase n=1 Tax=Nostoc sp. TaxID=1180 RepID=UPI002FF477E3
MLPCFPQLEQQDSPTIPIKVGGGRNALNGRIVAPYEGWNKHLDLIKTCPNIGAAHIVYQRSSKIYYLMVSLEIELPDISPTTITRISGVDVGMRYLAVETDLNNKSAFYSGKASRHRANQYQKARRTLQRKDTRKVLRRLISLSGRERRFIADVNHQISKEIAKPKLPKMWAYIEG